MMQKQAKVHDMLKTITIIETILLRISAPGLMRMDDVDDTFMPLSINGISLTSRNDDISLSQVSSTSRLSRSYMKSRKSTGYWSKSICVGSTVESMVTKVGMNQCKDSDHQPSANRVQFCPVCQAPFDIMKVYPHLHVHECNIKFDELEECPLGETCFNVSLRHYRDYAHTALAKMRASKDHLPQCLQYATSEKVNKIKHKEEQLLLSPLTPLTSNRSIKRTSNDVQWHTPAHKKKLFSNEKQSCSVRRGDCNNVLLQKCDFDQTCVENAVRNIEIVDHVIEDLHLESFASDKKDEMKLIRINGRKYALPNERTSSDLKFCDDNLKSTVESGNSEGSKSNILTTVDHNYTTDKLGTRCGENSNIETRILPCKVESDSECLHEVGATMSVVLSKSKQSSGDDENKLRTPVKVDASCREIGWETVEIAALPDTEVGDVMISLCKCSKTMQVNCSLSQEHTTIFSDERVTKKKELESKFFSNVKELKLPYNRSKKEVAEVPHRQMSITSYFQSSRSERSSADGTKGVKSTNSSVVASQDSHFFKSYDMNIARKDYVGNSCDVPNHNKEFVVTHWKQLLHGMKQKGLSTMNVFNDSSLTITSNSHTSASSLHSLQQYSGKKTCPYYKRIPDTSFVVDAFQYGIIPGISHYFLSHFHSDHYGGLRKSFSKPIYCSRITAALVKMKLRVDERYLHVLDLDVPQNINDVLVTSMDANHCPGSVMFLFQLQDGRNFLHVGDFRADPKMESYPCFWNSEIDKLYLDTTYCNPRYSFPVQSETITRVVELAKEHHRMVPSTLFVCGTYTLGKEKVFLGIVEALNCKLWAHSDKRKVLECIENPIINERLTNKQWEACVHVCRMCDINMSFLTRYLEQHHGVFTDIVAFIPTGWEMSRRNKNADNVRRTQYGKVTIYGIPYSEHSSFTELKRFVQFLKPAEVIPTVNVERSANAMTKYFRQWLSETPITSLKQRNERDQFVQQKMSRYFQSQMIPTDEDL